MDKVIHFELPADDVSRARKFYGDVFGWNANEVPQMQYTLVQTAPSDEQGQPKELGSINGGMMKRTEPFGGPIITVGVDDIDEAARRIEANGGKVVLSKQQVGDMGFSAYFKDTEGNTIGLWQDPS